MCLPTRRRASAPSRMAQLSLSLPPEVNASSPSRAPRAAMICARARSRTALASRPFLWVELGLP